MKNFNNSFTGSIGGATRTTMDALPNVYRDRTGLDHYYTGDSSDDPLQRVGNDIFNNKAITQLALNDIKLREWQQINQIDNSNNATFARSASNLTDALNFESPGFGRRFADNNIAALKGAASGTQYGGFPIGTIVGGVIGGVGNGISQIIGRGRQKAMQREANTDYAYKVDSLNNKYNNMMEDMNYLGLANFAAKGGYINYFPDGGFAESGDPYATTFNAGGTHEENPNGGIQAGVDPQGTPNVFEENEVVTKNLGEQDYAFSERINVRNDILEKFNLPQVSKKENGKMSWADYVLEQKEVLDENPNDIIEVNSFAEFNKRAIQASEYQKQLEEAEKQKEAINQMSDDELIQYNQQTQQQQPQQEPMPQDGQAVYDPNAVPQAAPEMPADMGAMGPGMDPAMMLQLAMQQQGMFACGGKVKNRYDLGGLLGGINAVSSNIREGMNRNNSNKQVYGMPYNGNKGGWFKSIANGIMAGSEQLASDFLAQGEDGSSLLLLWQNSKPSQTQTLSGVATTSPKEKTLNLDSLDADNQKWLDWIKQQPNYGYKTWAYGGKVTKEKEEKVIPAIEKQMEKDDVDTYYDIVNILGGKQYQFPNINDYYKIYGKTKEKEKSSISSNGKNNNESWIFDTNGGVYDFGPNMKHMYLEYGINPRIYNPNDSSQTYINFDGQNVTKKDSINFNTYLKDNNLPYIEKYADKYYREKGPNDWEYESFAYGGEVPYANDRKRGLDLGRNYYATSGIVNKNDPYYMGANTKAYLKGLVDPWKQYGYDTADEYLNMVNGWDDNTLADNWQLMISDFQNGKYRTNVNLATINKNLQTYKDILQRNDYNTMRKYMNDWNKVGAVTDYMARRFKPTESEPVVDVEPEPVTTTPVAPAPQPAEPQPKEPKNIKLEMLTHDDKPADIPKGDISRSLYTGDVPPNYPIDGRNHLYDRYNNIANYLATRTAADSILPPRVDRSGLAYYYDAANQYRDRTAPLVGGKVAPHYTDYSAELNENKAKNLAQMELMYNAYQSNPYLASQMGAASTQAANTAADKIRTQYYDTNFKERQVADEFNSKIDQANQNALTANNQINAGLQQARAQALQAIGNNIDSYNQLDLNNAIAAKQNHYTMMNNIANQRFNQDEALYAWLSRPQNGMFWSRYYGTPYNPMTYSMWKNWLEQDKEKNKLDYDSWLQRQMPFTWNTQNGNYIPTYDVPLNYTKK